MKKTIITVSLLCAYSLSAHAANNDTVQVVLGHKLTPSQSISVQGFDATSNALQTAKQATRIECVAAGTTQFNWCLPVRDRDIKILGVMTEQNGTVRPSSNRSLPPFDAVQIERHGMTDNEIINAIYATGLYENVEIFGEFKSMGSGYVPGVPFVTSGHIHKGPDYELFNDEWWYAQRGTHYRVGDTAMSVGVAGVMARSAEASQERYPIFVLDSGFSVSDDVPYADGRNFVSFGETSYELDPYDYSPRGDVTACDGHGLAVAGTMAASRGNGDGAAGIAANADIYALRVLQCGSGDGFDAIQALLWLAGIPTDHQPDVYTGKPGVVNMSFGGEMNFYGDDVVEGVPQCGFTFQYAVDAAIEAGFTLVAAAGNDSVDAWNYAPASCEGVIAVGATQLNGRLAGFSNTGSLIDVNAPGVLVYADGTPYGNPEDVHMRNHAGTSFAAPIVAGLIAETQRHYDLTPAQAQMLVSQTAFDPTLRGSSRCEDGKCGPGRLDGEEFFLAAKALNEGRLHRISHALAGTDSDEQSWLFDNFGDRNGACDSYQVDFFNGHSQAGHTYKVVESFKGADFAQDGFSEVGRFASGSVVISGIDADGSDYAFQVCTEDGGCDGEFYRFHTADALSTSKPEICAG